jgi:predicted ribosomally synthesized peptide with SipW-like signal peptide
LKFEIKEREEKIMANQNPYIVIEQKEESKKRTWVAVVLAVAFVAILGIGGTFAYLTWTTNQTPNRFTTDPTITADLLEPTWTKGAKASATEAGQATPDETKVGKASDGEYIPIEADNMLPGVQVDKNPFIVNTSNNGAKVYAGMKLQFQKWVVDTQGDDANGKYVNMTDDEVSKLAAVYAFNSSESNDKDTAAGFSWATGWNEIDKAENTDYAQAGAKYFYYGSDYSDAIDALPANTTEVEDDSVWGIDQEYRTAPLFTKVRMIDGATQANINDFNAVLKSGKDGTGSNFAVDPGWRVVISGAAIQATDGGLTPSEFVTDATANWKTLLDNVGTTTDTTVSAKPHKATGTRLGFTTGKYTSANAGTVEGIPEATNVNKDGN